MIEERLDKKRLPEAATDDKVSEVRPAWERSLGKAKGKDDVKLWPFRVISGQEDKPESVVNAQGCEQRFRPEEVSKVILLTTKETEEAYLGSPHKKDEVTVPACFKALQHQAAKDSGCDKSTVREVDSVGESASVPRAQLYKQRYGDSVGAEDFEECFTEKDGVLGIKLLGAAPLDRGRPTTSECLRFSAVCIR